METIEGVVKYVIGTIEEQEKLSKTVYRMEIGIQSDGSHVEKLCFKGCWPIRKGDYS